MASRKIVCLLSSHERVSAEEMEIQFLFPKFSQVLPFTQDHFVILNIPAESLLASLVSG